MLYFVYLTTNLLTGKQYVGDHSTDNSNDNYLGSGKPYFERALKEYGKNNFKREILEFFPSKQEAFDAQEKYIKKYNTLVPNGYNISPKGGYGVTKSCLSESTKKKIGDSSRGRIHSAESKLKMGRKGRKVSKETKEKMKISAKNRPPISEQTRLKMKIAKLNKRMEEKSKIKLSNSKKGNPSPMKGKKHSDETKLKMSLSKKGIGIGRILSEEHKIKIRENNGMKNRGFLVTGSLNGMYKKKRGIK
jgi:hypothetical protein